MRYTKVDIKTKTDLKPSYFMGSALRGAYGYALKKTVCVNPMYKNENCEDCFAKENCLFYDFYEKKDVSHPFRFDIQLGTKGYNFSFYTFEDSCEKIPYLLSAFYQMFTNIGLGKDKTKIDDFTIHINDTLAYDGAEFKLPDNYIQEYKKTINSPTIILSLQTPLRMKKQKRFIKEQDDLDLIDILVSINKRYCELKGIEYQKIYFEKNYKIIHKNLRFQDLTRYSNQQKTKMNFGGMIGDMVISGIDKQSLEILSIGELIGVGKQTVFGLGKIEIKEIYE